MIVSTAPTLEGGRIVEYAGLVPGEAATGADIVGGRTGACEKVPGDARDAAIGEMTDEAASRGANAAVGDRGSMLMVSANCTAVAVE